MIDEKENTGFYASDVRKAIEAYNATAKKSLTGTVSAVLFVLASYADNETREAYPKQSQIAKILDVTRTFVNKAIGTLKKAGLLSSQKKYVEGKTITANLSKKRLTVYTILPNFNTPPEQLVEPISGGNMPKQAHTNTSTWTHKELPTGTTHKSKVSDPAERGVSFAVRDEMKNHVFEVLKMHYIVEWNGDNDIFPSDLEDYQVYTKNSKQDKKKKRYPLEKSAMAFAERIIQHVLSLDTEFDDFESQVSWYMGNVLDSAIPYLKVKHGHMGDVTNVGVIMTHLKDYSEACQKHGIALDAHGAVGQLKEKRIEKIMADIPF